MVTQRWIVTYTKHMKQKRKVYQDGVLELCSSSGAPQVILYDDCEKLIDRRFLKKDDIVKSGGALSFETHIVEIGDPDESNTPSAESSEKPGIGLEPQKEKLCLEWNVLYTTQLTQKAKKYHDGVLRLPACNSNLNLIVLLNEDGVVLSRKYIKSVACLDTGISCEFPNYFVKICERRASPAIQDLQKNHSTKVTNSCSSKVVEVKTSTAPLRDVCQILSVLKKPSPERSLALEDPLVEQGLTSESSHKCQLEIQDSHVPSVSGDVLVQDADCEGSSSVYNLASSSWLSGNVDQGPVELFSSPPGPTKDPEISSSIELANLEQLPTFDLGF